MNIAPGVAIDWRDAQAYSGLLDADRSLFAWEWLRRDPSYRAAVREGDTLVAAAQDSARQFGLVRFEPPEASVPVARPLWRSEMDAQVLVAQTSGDVGPGHELNLDAIGAFVHVVRSGETDHLLLSDGFRAIRVDAPGGAFAANSIALSIRVTGLILGEVPLLALRRLMGLVRSGGFSSSLHPPEIRARRWILQLRAHDALLAGADLREIAEELLGRPAARPGWRSRDPSLRSQAQRLVRSARILGNGGFRQLFRD